MKSPKKSGPPPGPRAKGGTAGPSAFPRSSITNRSGQKTASLPLFPAGAGKTRKGCSIFQTQTPLPLRSRNEQGGPPVQRRALGQNFWGKSRCLVAKCGGLCYNRSKPNQKLPPGSRAFACASLGLGRRADGCFFLPRAMERHRPPGLVGRPPGTLPGKRRTRDERRDETMLSGDREDQAVSFKRKTFRRSKCSKTSSTIFPGPKRSCG